MPLRALNRQIKRGTPYSWCTRLRKGSCKDRDFSIWSIGRKIICECRRNETAGSMCSVGFAERSSVTDNAVIKVARGFGRFDNRERMNVSRMTTHFLNRT